MLPDQLHCYFLNGDAPVQDGRSLQGALVSKIPFRHPAQVPLLLDIIRHQAAYNTLIASCVKYSSIKEGKNWIPSYKRLVSQSHALIFFILCNSSHLSTKASLLLFPQILQACYSLKFVLSLTQVSASLFSIQSMSH